MRTDTHSFERGERDHPGASVYIRGVCARSLRMLLLLLALIILVGCSEAPGAAQPSPTILQPPTQAPVAPTGAPIARPSPAAELTPPAPTTPSTAPETTPAPEMTGTLPTAPALPTAAPAAPATPELSSAPDAPAPPAYSYPIGAPGKPLGDGFFIRHGAQVENTWYNPGYWHTGEDWYAIEGDTAGAHVYAIADGTVVYAGSNYPGRVVIVRHADDLYSMYGHLDPALDVQVDQRVRRGDLLGTVLRRDDNVPSHLHFEVRTFLTKREVNGDAPRYSFRCGASCPPGPGYWPMNAPDLPSDLGWLNPTHTINWRVFVRRTGVPIGEVVVASPPVSASLTLWSAPPGVRETRQSLGELALQPGARYALVAIDAGPEATTLTSADSYELWYRIVLPDERSGWVQAAVPSTFETGSDGRPSSVRFNFVLAIGAAP